MGLPSNAVEYSTWPGVPSASIQSLLMRRRPAPASITFMVYFFMGGLGSNLDFAMLRSQSPKSTSKFPAKAAPAAETPRPTTASVVAISLTLLTIPHVFVGSMRRKLAPRSRGRSRVEVNSHMPRPLQFGRVLRFENRPLPNPKSVRAPVIASVMATMAMIAIEATIVSTAMPQIVADLGGLRLYSWVFSSFLLAQTAMTVVFGNLADIYGRKPIMLSGIAIFVFGSILPGFSWSMPTMILFRLVQGIGAGAMQPVAMIIVADLYPARGRGKSQGYLASVWAISAVLGPVVGGLIIRNFSWAWIFWINIPIGMIAAAGFVTFLHENIQHERRPIDVGGATTFTIAIASLLIGLTKAGTSDTGIFAAAAGVFCISVVAFVVQERRTANPM